MLIIFTEPSPKRHFWSKTGPRRAPYVFWTGCVSPVLFQFRKNSLEQLGKSWGLTPLVIHHVPCSMAILGGITHSRTDPHAGDFIRCQSRKISHFESLTFMGISSYGLSSQDTKLRIVDLQKNATTTQMKTGKVSGASGSLDLVLKKTIHLLRKEPKTRRHAVNFIFCKLHFCTPKTPPKTP